MSIRDSIRGYYLAKLERMRRFAHVHGISTKCIAVPLKLDVEISRKPFTSFE